MTYVECSSILGEVCVYVVAIQHRFYVSIASGWNEEKLGAQAKIDS